MGSLHPRVLGAVWQDILVGQCRAAGGQQAPRQGAYVRGERASMLVILLPTHTRALSTLWASGTLSFKEGH